MPIAPAAPAPAGNSTPAPAAPAGGSAPAAKPAGGAPPVKPTQAGAPPPPGGAAKPAPQPTTPQKFKRVEKVDGKEVELEATEDELWASHRQRTAADRRFEEAARIRKEAAEESRRTEGTLARLKDRKEWIKAIREANPDADVAHELAQELQQLLHEEEQLQDPNIRERRRLEQENQTLREAEEQRQNADLQRQHEEQVAAETEKWAGLFTEAIELTGIPVNDITMSLMAQAQMTAKKRGIPLTPEKLAASTKKAVHGLIESIVANESVTDEQVLDAFPSLTKRIHKAIVARYKSRKETGQKPTADLTPRARKPTEHADPEKPRTMSSADEHKAYGIKGLRTI